MHFAPGCGVDILLIQESNVYNLRHVSRFNAGSATASCFLFTWTHCTGAGELIFRPAIIPNDFGSLAAEGRVHVLSFFIGATKHRAVALHGPGSFSVCNGFFSVALSRIFWNPDRVGDAVTSPDDSILLEMLVR